MIQGIHGRDIGQQRLRGTDIAGGLVSADMLLPGLQTQPIGGLLLLVPVNINKVLVSIACL